MKQFADLQDEYDALYMVADYHGLNFIQDGSLMRAHIIDLVKDYLAIGIDPARATLFKQSDISAHTELTWIFDTITTMPYLMRAHAFKDAEAKDAEISVGTFNYPMLMAADILLYDAEVVPVGQDQKQHIEYARDTAEKFNRVFSDTFTLPKELMIEKVAIVPGTDGRKMSKSYGNTIPLFAERDEIAKAVMSIVTDSSGGRPANVYANHALLKPVYELEELYTANEGSYKALKEALIEDLDAFIAPLRERRAGITDGDVRDVLTEGGERARGIADAKMDDVRRKIGVTL
jgi:tryptophanyl-tRNA synthetase